jgi:hypothetical protein
MAKNRVSSNARAAIQFGKPAQYKSGDEIRFEVATAARSRMEQLLEAITALVEQFNAEFPAATLETGTALALGEAELRHLEPPDFGGGRKSSN